MRTRGDIRGMRLLMTTDAVGGVWSYSLDLSRLLTARGVEIVLAVMGPGPDASQRAEAGAIENLELHHRPFDLEWFQGVSGLEILRASDWLKQLAGDYSPDLLHLNGYAHAAAGWTIPVLVVAHSCVYSWWMSVHHSDPPNEYRVYRGRVMAGLRAASAVAAPSNWMLKTLRSVYDLDLPNAEVIPNFTFCRSGRSKKEEFILASGRFWDSAKNLALLDRIAPELMWPVHVAGSLENPDGGCGTFHHVRTIGQLSREAMAERYANAAIFAHPARYEPFGLAVLEAAANGCALVLADIPSLRELWESCAIFASPEKPADWVDSLNRLAGSENDRIALGRAARRRAAEFSPDAALCGYMHLYERLTSLQPEPALSTIELHEHSHQTVLPLHRF
jgi:glycosyltransferase involved in cell wall biosynthesis